MAPYVCSRLDRIKRDLILHQDEHDAGREARILPQKSKQFGRVVGADRVARLLDQRVVAGLRSEVEPQRAEREDKLRGLVFAARATLLAFTARASLLV
jgi:hypothetical protein